MAQQVVEETEQAEKACWGWLEPGSTVMPYVVISGNGAAIGRGREVFEERTKTVERDDFWSNQLFVGRKNEPELYSGLDFVEVADGRVSRLHCAILHKQRKSACTLPILEDCSTNGTFVNNQKVGQGKTRILSDNDRISLVLSVTPLAEKYFIYHTGPPPLQTLEKFKRRGAVQRLNSCRSLSKCPTNKYITEDRCTLEDLECQICLNPFVDCVTIEPCGHSFCAGCLSNYLAKQLEGGAQVVCPLRCAQPQRFVKNENIRNLVERKKTESGKLRLSTDFDNEDELMDVIEDEISATVSPSCPLTDDQLPVEVKSLKILQVDRTLRQLMDDGITEGETNSWLEGLARLCWSDDEARKRVFDNSGIRLIKAVMEKSIDDEAVQCHGCLALMAMVRGDGPLCQSAQWEIGQSGAVEVIGTAMRRHASNPMVQLSAMLCFIPITLDNPVMQAHLTQSILPEILTALDRHPSEADVQCKGLIVLGVIAQGEDGIHDAIRSQQIEEGMIWRVVSALKIYGSSNEDVFWGALFALATLAREDGPRFHSVRHSLCQSGMHELVAGALDSYETRMRHNNQQLDDMIVITAHHLLHTFADAERQLLYDWKRYMYCGFGIGAFFSFVYCYVRRRHRS